jgi:hypothetical protein
MLLQTNSNYRSTEQCVYGSVKSRAVFLKQATGILPLVYIEADLCW